MPIILLGIFLVSIMSNNTETAINEFRNVLSGYIVTPIGLAVIIAITEFLTSMLYIAPTAISRDGINAVFMKYIPVSYYKQLIYKAIPSVVFGTITSIIVLIFVWVIAKTSIIFILTAFIINLVLLILQTLLMELVDLRKPKLEWTTEYAVVKQNMNLMWPAILGVVNIGIIIALTILFSWLPYWGYSILLFTITIIILLILQKYIKRNQVKLFEKIY